VSQGGAGPGSASLLCRRHRPAGSPCRPGQGPDSAACAGDSAWDGFDPSSGRISRFSYGNGAVPLSLGGGSRSSRSIPMTAFHRPNPRDGVWAWLEQRIGATGFAGRPFSGKNPARMRLGGTNQVSPSPPLCPTRHKGANPNAACHTDTSCRKILTANAPPGVTRLGTCN